MKNNKIAVITAEFNSEITHDLRDECVKKLLLKQCEVSKFSCPGAVELIPAAKRISKNNRFDTIIIIGAIIKGDTDHYEYVCQLVINSFTHFIQNADIPVIFGVLTTQNEELAKERSDPKKMNKGAEFAQSALDMLQLFNEN